MAVVPLQEAIAPPDPLTAWVRRMESAVRRAREAAEKAALQADLERKLASGELEWEGAPGQSAIIPRRIPPPPPNVHLSGLGLSPPPQTPVHTTAQGVPLARPKPRRPNIFERAASAIPVAGPALAGVLSELPGGSQAAPRPTGIEGVRATFAPLGATVPGMPTVQRVAGDVARTVFGPEPLVLPLPYTFGLLPPNVEVTAEEVAEVAVPTHVWEVALELMPGVGTVPGAISAARRLGPEFTTGLRVAATKGDDAVRAYVRNALKSAPTDIARAVPEPRPSMRIAREVTTGEAYPIAGGARRADEAERIGAFLAGEPLPAKSVERMTQGELRAELTRRGLPDIPGESKASMLSRVKAAAPREAGEQVTRKTVAELRAEAKAKGLPSTGTKTQLEARLAETPVPPAAGAPPPPRGGAAVPPGGPETIAKLVAATRHAEKLPPQTEALRHVERQRRVAIGASQLEHSGRSEESYRRALAAQAGEMLRTQFKPLAEAFTEPERAVLREKLGQSGLQFYDELTAKGALDKVIEGRLANLAPHELVLLDRVFGPKLAEAIARSKVPAGMRCTRVQEL